MIELSVQEINNANSFNYTWVNGLGDTIGKSNTITFAANDAEAIPPYFARVTFGDCGTVSSIPVNVNVIEIPAFSVTNNGPVCQGTAVQLSATEVANGNYTWRDASTGDIISTLQNPIILAIDATTTYELSISKDGCNNGQIASTTVDVFEKPSITNLASS